MLRNNADAHRPSYFELRLPSFHFNLPSPGFFFLTKNEKKIQFADWLIELANRGFGLSGDAFLKSVKKFLDKEARTIPFKTASQAEVVSEFHHFFNSFPFY